MDPMDHYPADPVNPVEKSLRYTKKLIDSNTDISVFHPCFIRVHSVA